MNLDATVWPMSSSMAIQICLLTLSLRNYSLPNDKNLDRSKLKAFADDKINMSEKLKFVLGMVENVVEKGEYAGC